MTKLVLLLRADSIYEDVPDERYDFPRAYLKAVEEGIGDWVVYYEPVKAGPRGYFAVAKIARVIPKPGVEGRFLAIMEPGSYLEFDRDVPRLRGGRPWEAALADAQGLPKAGGLYRIQCGRCQIPSSPRLSGPGCRSIWKVSKPDATKRCVARSTKVPPRSSAR
jgi:putative restriction endonuclease